MKKLEHVHLERIIGDCLKLLRGGKLHCKHMIVVNHRVAQLIVLIAVLKDGFGKFFALGQPEPFIDGEGDDNYEKTGTAL